MALFSSAGRLESESFFKESRKEEKPVPASPAKKGPNMKKITDLNPGMLYQSLSRQAARIDMPAPKTFIDLRLEEAKREFNLCLSKTSQPSPEKAKEDKKTEARRARAAALFKRDPELSELARLRGEGTLDLGNVNFSLNRVNNVSIQERRRLTQEKLLTQLQQSMEEQR